MHSHLDNFIYITPGDSYITLGGTYIAPGGNAAFLRSNVQRIGTNRNFNVNTMTIVVVYC